MPGTVTTSPAIAGHAGGIGSPGSAKKRAKKYDHTKPQRHQGFKTKKPFFVSLCLRVRKGFVAMRCPLCGGEFDIMDAQMDQDWLNIVKLLPTFGGHGNLAFEYVEKFGVCPVRMKGKKILRLLEEMSRLFRSGEFVYQRRKYTTSNQVVIEAVKAVVNKHFASPLENHNYLKKVMISLHEEAQREESKRKERELREREQVLMSAGRVGDLSAEVGIRQTDGGQALSAEEEKVMTAREYLAKVGKTSLLEK
jgi:hypothetical protein